jgi:hypothetical protein
VQVGHACLEAGSRFYSNHGTPANLVLFQVQNIAELDEATVACIQAGIRLEYIFEPDDAMGYTAIATEPLSGKMREVFRQYQLWK